jgi:hypothetical protein
MVFCRYCEFFKPFDDKQGTCNNENSVYFGIKISKNGRCNKGVEK